MSQNPSNLQIHPELTRRQGEGGVFELTGLPGGFRVWFGYDNEGMIRTVTGRNDRDVNEGLLGQIKSELAELVKRDEQRHA